MFFVDRMVSQGWATRGTVSTAYTARPLLREIATIIHKQHIHSSIYRVDGEDKTMVDIPSRITHLSDRIFLHHLKTSFP